MNDSIQDYAKRPRRYENIDGSLEMFFGLFWLAAAVTSATEPMLSFDSRWQNLLFIYAIFLPVIALGHWGGKALKKYVTYPRTGYVAYRAEAKRKGAGMIIAAVVAAALAGALVLVKRQGLELMDVNAADLFVVGSVVATYALFIFATSREHRWKWLVALIMAVGALAIVPWPFSMTALFFGCTWLASGAITLYLYIRRTQPPVPAQ